MVKMIVSAQNNACLLSNNERLERPLNKIKVDDDSIRSLDEKKPSVTSGQEHFWGKSIIVKVCNQESSSWMEKQRGHNKVQTTGYIQKLLNPQIKAEPLLLSHILTDLDSTVVENRGKTTKQ